MAGQLRSQVGAGSREAECLRGKLPLAAALRLPGMVGDAGRGRKSHLHNTGDHDIPQTISGSSVCLEMAAESTSMVFSDCFMSAVCNEEF